jgi:hypothetical protein
MLGIERATIPALNSGTNIDSFFKQCVEAAPPLVQPFLAHLQDKNTPEASDAGDMLYNAKQAAEAVASPQRATLQQGLTAAFAAVDNTPGAQEAQTPAMMAATARVNTDRMKLLNETVKLSGQSGPVTAFLRDVIQRQPAEIKSRFETMDFTNQHPLYVAIAKCDIKAFRRLLTETFDLVHPREERMRKCQEEIQKITFNSEHQHLMHMRSLLIDAVSKIKQLTDGATHVDLRTSALRTTLTHFQKLVNSMTDLNMKLTVATAISTQLPLTVDKLCDLLEAADGTMRVNYFGTYPPQELVQQIPVHVARPDAKSKPKYPVCVPCLDRWGVKWEHTPDRCCLQSEEKRYKDMKAKKDARWLEDHPGETLPPLNESSSDKRKRTKGTQEKASSPSKRERNM